MHPVAAIAACHAFRVFVSIKREYVDNSRLPAKLAAYITRSLARLRRIPRYQDIFSSLSGHLLARLRSAGHFKADSDALVVWI